MLLYRCILLLEDLDAAFTRSVTRDSTSTGTPTSTKDKDTAENDGSTLSLSGLLNSLDGVAGIYFRYLTLARFTYVFLIVLQPQRAGEH
jgi:chaperone BCS1